MLLSLAIRDIVLIDSLSLVFDAGLTVLTGETGAGKSILLDSLGLATGARADSALVRRGAARGQVVASFDIRDNAAVRALLDEQGLDDGEGQLLLRRLVDADGGSRAFINDQPVSVGLMRQFGDLLLEVHGQHDDRGLLDTAGHRALLDLYGGHDRYLEQVGAAHAALKAARAGLREAEERVAAARADEDYLRHAVAEIDAFAPDPGEEQALAERRALLMQGERLLTTLSELMAEVGADGGLDAGLRAVCRRLERIEGVEAAALFEPALTAFSRAAVEAEEGRTALARAQDRLAFDPREAETIEERLFGLRALARKHRIAADALPALYQDLKARLEQLETGAASLTALQGAVARAEAAFREAVARLTRARRETAVRLDAAVAAELPPLKLEKARFRTTISPLEPKGWSAEGGEQVAFEVSTNPGAPFGPMIRIASGGELARFILALKVALAAETGVRTLVFDEVDRGIGGATADAVGERLARLAHGAQLLVVTHSPQVAARGARHLRIGKSELRGADGPESRTSVAELDAAARREEIARMLSGAEITDAARAAADSLLGAVFSA